MGQLRKALCSIGTAIALGLILCIPAQATIVSGSFNLTASGFGAGAPVDPVMGTFSFSFDNAASFIGGGSLTISLNLPGTIGPGMDYDKATDILRIGDVLNGVCCVSGGNDYGFSIHNVSTNPTLGSLIYSENATGTTVFSATEGSITPIGTPAPEPGTLALLGLGLAGLAVVRRRKLH